MDGTGLVKWGRGGVHQGVGGRGGSLRETARGGVCDQAFPLNERIFTENFPLLSGRMQLGSTHFCLDHVPVESLVTYAADGHRTHACPRASHHEQRNIRACPRALVHLNIHA